MREGRKEGGKEGREGGVLLNPESLKDPKKKAHFDRYANEGTFFEEGMRRNEGRGETGKGG